MKFTQNDEGEAIANYFGSKVGTFCSLGENDGQTFSNVRALAMSGWCGVMVEPSPRAFHRLKQLYDKERKGCFYLYPFAIGNSNGKITLYESGELVKTNDIALVSTTVEHEMKRFASVTTYEPVEVDCYTWKTFLNRCTIRKFDFISIDCEGLDGDILEQIDLSGTSCVCIEWNGNEMLKTRFSNYMKDFKIIYTSPENLIYCR